MSHTQNTVFCVCVNVEPGSIVLKHTWWSGNACPLLAVNARCVSAWHSMIARRSRVQMCHRYAERLLYAASVAAARACCLLVPMPPDVV